MRAHGESGVRIQEEIRESSLISASGRCVGGGCKAHSPPPHKNHKRSQKISHTVITLKPDVFCIALQRRMHLGISSSLGRTKREGMGMSPHTKPHAAPADTTTQPPLSGSGPQLISAHRPTRIRWCPHKPFNAARFGDYLSTSLAARQLTNGGPLQQILAAKLEAVTGSARPIIPAASGTAALHALAGAWALHKGRPLRWATQAFTFPTSFQGPFADAIVLDLDPDRWGPSMAGLDACVTAIDGIVLTNVFGLQADIAGYEAWCSTHDKLLLLDNAATATGRLPDGRCVHDAGDGAIVSLHETKPIGRGEGGAVIAPVALAGAVVRAMNFGFDVAAGQREGHRLASNYRMSDIAAAAALDHLDTVIIEEWTGKLTALAAYADRCLTEAGLTTHLPLPADSMPACLFIRLPAGVRGDRVCAAMCALAEGTVEAKQYYRPLVDRAAAPVAWRVFDGCVCVPLHVDMSTADVDYVCSALRRIMLMGEEEGGREEKGDRKAQRQG